MFDRIGVIGDKDSILAFKTVGLEVFDAPSGETARSLLRQLTYENFAIIFITEQYAVENEDLIEKSKAKEFPAIIPIPTSKGSTGFGLENVKKDVEKALGVDILFSRED